MVAPEVGGVPASIIMVAGPVAGWAAVAVAPPYREFPTVVLFRMSADGTWRRIQEGLTPGVQPQRSPQLDVHTTGQAFDYTVSSDGAPVTSAVIDKLLALPPQQRLSTVAHAFFFHAHLAGPENYFVDRTTAYQAAVRFFPGQYETYPRTECTMFDVPATDRITLASSGDRLVLTAQTDNGQLWTISWLGVDNRGLLIGKTVEARAAPGRR